MTGPEYTHALTTLSLTPDQAAIWLGIGRSTAYRYLKTGCEGPVAVAIRQRLAIEGLERFEEMISLGDEGYMVADDDGRWVRYCDVAEIA